MSFFTDIDAISILERNHMKVEGLELKEARKLQKVYQRAREELRLQLLMVNDNTFTEAKLKTAMLQVEQILNHINHRIKKDTFGIEFIWESGVEDSVKEVNTFEKYFTGVSSALPFEEILAATERENYLFNQFQTSIETYNSRLRGRFQQQLTQSLIQKKTWSQAVWEMEQVFGQEEWTMARIVRTELHNIYNVGKMRGMGQIQKDYIPTLQKTLYHPIDSRTGDDSKQAEAKKLIVNIDEPFRYTYSRKRADGSVVKEFREFMTPPDRPNDRAILIPYSVKWD
jgi:hypothetical protein